MGQDLQAKEVSRWENCSLCSVFYTESGFCRGVLTLPCFTSVLLRFTTRRCC